MQPRSEHNQKEEKMLNIYDDYAEIGVGAEIGDDVGIGHGVNIGDDVRIGYGAKIGDDVRVGDYVKIGDYATIGHNATIGKSFRVGECAEIGHSAVIGENASIGDYTTLGNWATLGNWVTIGDHVEIGYGAQFGDCVTVGDKFRCEDLKVVDFFSLSNVDGTGRKIHVYVHTAGITIRAGCFIGTLDEFCMKAEDEGKYVYSTTVRAAAEAFAAEIHRQGKTGGWDK